MKSAWATTFISATATACARRCNGVRTRTPVSPARIRRAFTCRSSWTRPTITRPCNVEAQLDNPHSLLWWMRRLLALRKRWRALGEGKCEFLQPDNHKILSYILRHEQETILVVANLSRFAQPVELDLSAFKQMVPVELFGRMRFPGHHGRALFADARPAQLLLVFARSQTRNRWLPGLGAAGRALPSLAIVEDWQEIFTGSSRAKFEAHPARLPEVAAVVFRQDQNHQACRRSRNCFSVPVPDEHDAVLAVSPGRIMWRPTRNCMRCRWRLPPATRRGVCAKAASPN